MVEGMSSQLALKSSCSRLPERLSGSLTARLGLRWEAVSPVIMGMSHMTEVEAPVSALLNIESRGINQSRKQLIPQSISQQLCPQVSCTMPYQSISQQTGSLNNPPVSQSPNQSISQFINYLGGWVDVWMSGKVGRWMDAHKHVAI